MLCSGIRFALFVSFYLTSPKLKNLKLVYFTRYSFKVFLYISKGKQLYGLKVEKYNNFTLKELRHWDFAKFWS